MTVVHLNKNDATLLLTISGVILKTHYVRSLLSEH